MSNFHNYQNDLHYMMQNMKYHMQQDLQKDFARQFGCFKSEVLANCAREKVVIDGLNARIKSLEEENAFNVKRIDNQKKLFLLTRRDQVDDYNRIIALEKLVDDRIEKIPRPHYFDGEWITTSEMHAAVDLTAFANKNAEYLLANI
jgi:hypothetical protein